MKCSISLINLKLFCKSLHCLAKIGDDLYLTPMGTGGTGGSGGLTIKSFNQAKSAFIYATFKPQFFLTFICDLDSSSNSNWHKDFGPNKVSLKGLLLAFRSANILEKTVEICTLEINEGSNLHVKFTCKYQITKSFIFPFCNSTEPLKVRILNNNTEYAQVSR